MAGFTDRYRLSGGAPTIQKILAADTATYYKGDLVNLESGEADPAASDDSALLGVCLATTSCTDSTTYIDVITDADMVYGVTDANARVIGATLDLTGAAGSMTVEATVHADFTVVANSSATEETLVVITHGEHAWN